MVELQQNERLLQQLMTARVIGLSIAASLVVLSGVVEFFSANQPTLLAGLDPQQLNLLRWGAIVLAVSLFVLFGRLRSHRLGRDRSYASGVAQAMIPQERYRVLMQTALIGFTLVDVIAMLGFVLFLFSGEPGDYYLFAAFSILMLGVYFPRRVQWERWYASGDRVR